MSRPLDRLSLACFALVLAVTSSTSTAQRLDPPVVPAGNPLTADKILLGKTLFWDEQLSSTNTVACGTCHRPSAGGADPRTPFAIHPGADDVVGTADDRRGSPGVIATGADGRFTGNDLFGARPQVTPRAAPTVINAALFPELNWDGRARGLFVDPVDGSTVLPEDAALERQASDPPVDAIEMAHQGTDWTAVADRLEDARPLAVASDIPAALLAWLGDADYPTLFLRAFGDPAVTPARILQAIASYERTLISDQSPFDLDQLGFGTPEDRGVKLFFGRALCFACHGIESSADNGFFNNGLRPALEDPGRGAVTGFPIDMGRFKTPMLRNLAHRPTFFHTGTVATLEELVDFYDGGAGAFVPPGEPLFQLGLTGQEKADLIAFLRFGLEDPRVAAELPPFDRPTLFTETDRPASGRGVGTHGTFGIVPELFSPEPAFLGNGTFTVGLRDGAAGRPAFLLVDSAPGDGSIAFAGARLFLGLSPALQALPLANALGGSLWGEGFASLDLPVPSTRALDGMQFHLQALVLDYGAPGGVAASAGLDVTLFAPR